VFAIREEVSMYQVSAVSSSTATSTEAAPLPPFSCSWEQSRSGAAWVLVTGEVDLATSPKLRQTLRDAQHQGRPVVLDLREITFMDGAGARAILDAAADARRDHCQLILVRGSARVDRLLTLTGVWDQGQIVDLDPAEPTARTLLRRIQAGAAT
jgi:anti-anti-sigma factor